MGWQDDLVPVEAAPAPAGGIPAWQRDLIGAPEVPRGAPQRAASGVLDALQAGYQGSATGLMLRGKLPDVVLDPHNSTWYERAIATVGQIGSEFLQMIVGGALGTGAGTATGAAAGSVVPVLGTAAGGAAGGVLGAGAGMFMVPALIRESYIQALSKGEIVSVADFLDRAKIVLQTGGKEGLVGAATMGAGGLAARTVGKAIAPAVGEALSVPAATRVIGAAGTSAEIGTMVVTPAALAGRLPEPQDFLDAAIVIGGMKGAHAVSQGLRRVYERTGIPPEKVAADALADPAIKADLVRAYHGTDKVFGAEYKAGEGIGPHFGSKEVANDFAKGENANIRPVDLDIKNPLRLEDGGWENPPSVALKLYDKKIIGDSELAKMQEISNPLLTEYKSIRDVPEDVMRSANEKQFALLREWIKAKGYDSIIYKNTLEGDKKADSYIPLDWNNQVRGAFDIPRAYEPAAEAEMLRNALPEAPKVAEVIANPKGEIPVGKQPNHINYQYANTALEVKQLQARISDVMEKEIEAARRTESWDQTQSVANKEIEKRLSAMADGTKAALQGMSYERLAAETLALKAMADKAAYDAIQVATEIRAKGADATPADMARQVAAIETSAMVLAAYEGNGAEVARALNVRKAAKQSAALAEGMTDLLKKYGDDPHVLANMVLGLHTTAEMANFARKAHKATKWEMFVEAWKAGILSGPVTSVANIMGNKGFELVRSPIDQIAAMIGMARGASVGERISMFEPAARVISSLQASLDGIKSYAAVMDVDVALRALKMDKAADAVAARRSVDMEPGKSEQFREAIPGAAGYIIRTSFRNLQGQDAFAQTTVRAGEAHALAIREAMKEGVPLMSREFWNRVEQLKDNPTEAMQKEIDAAALRLTFNEPLGANGQKFQALVKANRLELFFPFIRTPANIAAEMLRMSVFSPVLPKVRADLMGKNGGIARDRAMAEFIVGTSIMAAVSYYFFDGSISGSGDPDAGKRNVKRAAGWQPYSFKVGDTWYNYQRLQPVGTLVGLAADLANVWDHTDEEERDKIPKMLATAFANAITNQTFLQGVTAMVRTIGEPDRYGAKFFQQYAGSLVPAIVAQPVAMNDPFEREINSMLDAIKARLPGAREALIAKRDVFGEKLQTKDRFGVISPITETKESDDKVRSEAARLDVSVANAPKKIHLGRGTGKIGDVKLEPEKQDIFEDVGGHFAYKVLSEIVNAPGWDKIPDLVQKRIYTRVFAQAHKLAAQSVLTPEERANQLSTIVEKLQTELAPDE